MRQLEVCFTPEEYHSAHLAAAAVVVIDVLRATTSIATALAHGASKIIPVATIEEAHALKAATYPEALLAGERQGKLIPGFNLGNSPFEYGKKVKDQVLIMTTTNGTYSLVRAAASGNPVYTAALVNCQAVCDFLACGDEDVTVLCAGTDQRKSYEDSLCAGLICQRLADCFTLSEQALEAQRLYKDCRDLPTEVAASSHAKYLDKIGFSDDVAFCSQLDLYKIVPVFKDGVLTVLS